jgi:hypothetical protein
MQFFLLQFPLKGCSGAGAPKGGKMNLNHDIIINNDLENQQIYLHRPQNF